MKSQLGRRKLTAFTAIVLVGILAVVVPVPRVGGKPNITQLLWRRDEAYLFIGSMVLGWDVSYAKGSLELLGLTLPVTDSRPSVTAFKITPRRIERHVIDNYQMPDMAAQDNYVHNGAGKWTGSSFEPLSADEKARAMNGNHAPAFSDVGGWSKRSFILAGNVPSRTMATLDLGGTPAELCMVTDGSFVVTVELQRRGLLPERLWTVDERSHSVSRAEYESLFRRKIRK